jgi:integration host factor subunit alpha
MAITKIDLIGMVYDNIGVPRKDCGKLIESFFEIIRAELEEGNNVMISGFGKWSVKKKNRRQGRNPQTGKAITIDARSVVTFRPSAVLRKALMDSPQDKVK